MRILFTGADGYIGAVLGPKLLECGHHAIGLDTGLYRRGWLFDDHRTRPMVVTKDIRKVAVEDLRGYDAFVHLAELSNDPLAENDPGLTLMINHRGSVALAERAREAGVKRFIYASSCSIYGAGGTDLRTETAAANPQSAYARCKVLVERDVGTMKGDGFEPVFLRNATAFGASPRQRFDLVLNNLAGLAWTTKQIKMTSDGTPWRPLVHGLDIAKAILCTLRAPADVVHDQVFNVGDTAQNYQVRDIATIVAEAFPGCEVTFGQQGSDNRSYRVSFEKVNRELPGFRCEWDARRGAQQFRD